MVMLDAIIIIMGLSFIFYHIAYNIMQEYCMKGPFPWNFIAAYMIFHR